MAAEKARFYLEKSVPELREYEQKEIFTKEEIKSIAKKRSDFEHKVNGTGVVPSDFARYAEYEMNLEALRKKRVKRLAIRVSPHHGGRRVLFILDRATRRFPGDLGLWVQYIEYCRKHKMYKRLLQVFTDALRLHPTNADLWIYAAKYSFEEHADMTHARSYFQRGLRFCKSQKNMWVQYGRLECIYIAKLHARRQILGLDQPAPEKPAANNTTDDTNADMIALPVVTAEDVNPTRGEDEGVDKGALENLKATPALSGAIPMAIFDAAMDHFNNNPAFAREYFDMVFEFEDIPCLRRIIDHIVDRQIATASDNAHTAICHVKQPVAGIKVTSPDFPKGFGTSLANLKKYNLSANIAKDVISWLMPLSRNAELDPALRTVIVSTIRRMERAL
ncbi:hypothetical protein VTN49DRAFT_6487 [Thermomyces lanuginosus]|uniref:uncharacterized protein n=1 Tax=Thermomyces lanuginosus TaxID=5541 RepID=UPI003743C6B6